LGGSTSLASESGAKNATTCPGSIRFNALDTLQALSAPQLYHGSEGFVFAALGSSTLARWQLLAHRNASACSGGIGAPLAPETLQARHMPLS